MPTRIPTSSESQLGNARQCEKFVKLNVAEGLFLQVEQIEARRGDLNIVFKEKRSIFAPACALICPYRIRVC